ncbi:MAG: hypothetical protein J0M12_17355, partial [Deltaproteobacteria bacterium]|nr:hypothetical protein [Deltaproteobacteria bacterium]
MSNLFESLSFPLPFPELIQNISDAVPAFEIKREAAKRQLELLRKDPDISCTAALKIFDEMQRDLIAIVSIVGHLESVCTTDSIRAANTKLQELSAEFFAWLNSDPELYRFFSGLSPEPSVERTLQNLLFAFESSGAKLAPTQRERFIEIERELSELTNRLGEAVVDSTRAWNWHAESREELPGLLDSDCDAAKEAARAAGKTGYLFTLHAPSYLAILQFHKNRAVREHFARAYSRIASEAPHDNSQRISRILQLRAEKASLLGYENFVDLVTTDRMAKNAENIRMFFESMEAEVLSSSLRDLNALTQFAWKNGHPAGEPLKAWDMAFYLQRHEEQELGLDLEVIREYFPFEDTLERIFAFLSELFGVRFSTSKLPVWSEGVNSFNASGFGRSFGSLYTDYYARENKRAGAWMDMLMPSIRGAHPGIGFMAGNFSRPTADRPALLTHAEITTLFHEAGHLLHGLVCETERALDGMTH